METLQDWRHFLISFPSDEACMAQLKLLGDKIVPLLAVADKDSQTLAHLLVQRRLLGSVEYVLDYLATTPDLRIGGCDLAQWALSIHADNQSPAALGKGEPSAAALKAIESSGRIAELVQKHAEFGGVLTVEQLNRVEAHVSEVPALSARFKTLFLPLNMEVGAFADAVDDLQWNYREEVLKPGSSRQQAFWETLKTCSDGPLPVFATHANVFSRLAFSAHPLLRASSEGLSPDAIADAARPALMAWHMHQLIEKFVGDAEQDEYVPQSLSALTLSPEARATGIALHECLAQEVLATKPGWRSIFSGFQETPEELVSFVDDVFPLESRRSFWGRVIAQVDQLGALSTAELTELLRENPLWGSVMTPHLMSTPPAARQATASAILGGEPPSSPAQRQMQASVPVPVGGSWSGPGLI